MSGRYLLDTNIVSALLRDLHGAILERIRAVGEANVCTSVVVSAELRFGAAKKGSQRLHAQPEAVLAALEVLPLEPAVAAVYAETRWRLEQRRTPIGANDLFIAAHALFLECVLVTDNERAFGRVDGPPPALLLSRTKCGQSLGQSLRDSVEPRHSNFIRGPRASRRI